MSSNFVATTCARARSKHQNDNFSPHRQISPQHCWNWDYHENELFMFEIMPWHSHLSIRVTVKLRVESWCNARNAMMAAFALYTQQSSGKLRFQVQYRTSKSRMRTITSSGRQFFSVYLNNGMVSLDGPLCGAGVCGGRRFSSIIFGSLYQIGRKGVLLSIVGSCEHWCLVTIRYLWFSIEQIWFIWE